jgi:hypothetical protein
MAGAPSSNVPCSSQHAAGKTAVDVAMTSGERETRNDKRHCGNAAFTGGIHTTRRT